MIKTVGLTKTYGDLDAIRDVTFEVEKGTIVGFWGPTAPGNPRP